MDRAALDVTAELGAFLADVVRPFNPDIIVGLPTLGLSLAPIIARSLGHSQFTPLSLLLVPPSSCHGNTN